MNVKFLNPFVEAAHEVLRFETDQPLERGELRLDKETYVTDEVTAIISLVGRVVGTVFYSMNEKSAINIASSIMGEPFDSFSALAQSGIAEIGNVITGRASVKLSEAGFEANITPPALLLGKDAIISTLDYPRIIVPLTGAFGSMVIHLALRENQNFTGQAADVAPISAPGI